MKRGKDRSIIHTGEGKPSDILDNDTDLYIDSNTGDLYIKKSGSWSLTMNIKGEDCKDGQDGQKGNNGSSSSNGKLLGQIRYFLLKMVILKHLLVVFFLAIQ